MVRTKTAIFAKLNSSLTEVQMSKIFTVTLLSLFIVSNGFSQTPWQQSVNYKMDVKLNTDNHRFSGTQTLKYTNNSPDTLNKMFYHLYLNAFQPGSKMDVRSRTIKDPDRRVKDRISKLKENEIGFQEIESLKMNNLDCKYNIEGTILEVDLPQPIMPGEEAQFDMKFNAQVPVQIRRTGRHNQEGIEYTMTQWYPKACQYDFQGWHANPYVGREFYGIFGTFDVSITLDERYVVASTGVLTEKTKKDNLTTHRYVAENVHDFAWAADPDYVHDSIQVPDGPLLRFFYQTDTLAQQWRDIQPKVVSLFSMMNQRFGKYPYPEFSVIQGGDGGMEYPMCTMILGHGKEKGKVGLIAHEAFHNWYYGVIATNESKYAWMDEGFTSYAEAMIMHDLYDEDGLNPLARSYRNVRFMAGQDWEEPMSLPADFYNTNIAYGINAYSKGSVTLHQLSYIIGQETFDKGMLRYYNEYKFKHPTPVDFQRVMEKESGLDLAWYFEHWIYSTNHINYAIADVQGNRNETQIEIHKIGDMPMPLDIVVTLKNGEKHTVYVPLTLMRGNKPAEDGTPRLLQPAQPWTHPEFSVTVPFALKDIEVIELDPSERMADIDLTDNKWFTDKKKNEEYRNPDNDK